MRLALPPGLEEKRLIVASAHNTIAFLGGVPLIVSMFVGLFIEIPTNAAAQMISVSGYVDPAFTLSMQAEFSARSRLCTSGFFVPESLGKAFHKYLNVEVKRDGFAAKAIVNAKWLSGGACRWQLSDIWAVVRDRESQTRRVHIALNDSYYSPPLHVEEGPNGKPVLVPKEALDLTVYVECRPGRNRLSCTGPAEKEEYIASTYIKRQTYLPVRFTDSSTSVHFKIASRAPVH